MPTVLLIDDDLALRRAVAKALRLSGHDVLEADDGRKGLDMALRLAPDLVVTDVMMPVMDGVEAIRRIRAARPELPIIAISGSDTAWAAAQTFGWIGWGAESGREPRSPLAQARMEGADVTLGKPFEIGELMEAVAMVLARAQRRHEGGAAAAALPLIHVREDRAGRWTLQRDGAPLAAARAGTREEALFLARRLASGHRSARVVVYHPDGSVQSHFTYGEDVPTSD